MKNLVVDKIKRRQDIIILVVLVFVGLFFVYYAMDHQQRFWGGGDSGEKAIVPQKVQLSSQGKETNTAAEKTAQGQNSPKAVAQSSSYFLQPSANEVMEMVRQIVDSELPVPKESYNQLRIVWPVYYSQQISQDQEKVTMQFDTSQDGFGINVVTVLDALQYPEILVAKPYQKMWLAGAITGIDATGTGTIYMDTEQVRFQEKLVELQRRNVRK